MNTQKVQDFIHESDRDFAPFFAGRTSEIAHFRNVLSTAGSKKQARFLVFQGAPGCGKTSLVHHLEAKTRRDALFVSLYFSDLESREALGKKIERAIKSQRKKPSEALASLADLASKVLLGRPVSDDLWKVLHTVAPTEATLVLHLDEAHALEEPEERMVLNLHKTGLEGVPCIMVFTGLERTGMRMQAIKGMSRLAGDAVVTMGTMTQEECAASTQQLLAAFDVEGTIETRHTLCELVARLSHGWPQHLNIAQKALCRELLRVDGQPECIDTARMESEATHRRHIYYESRLNNPILGKNKHITFAVLSELAKKGACFKGEVEDMCRLSIKAHCNDAGDMKEYATPATYTETLIDKGILSEDDDNDLTFAIPSMGSWAQLRAEELARKRLTLWPPHQDNSSSKRWA